MTTPVRVPLSDVVKAERLDNPCGQCGAKAGELCRNVSREPVGAIRSASHFYRGAPPSEEGNGS